MGKLSAYVRNSEDTRRVGRPILSSLLSLPGIRDLSQSTRIGKLSLSILLQQDADQTARLSKRILMVKSSCKLRLSTVPGNEVEIDWIGNRAPTSPVTWNSYYGN